MGDLDNTNDPNMVNQPYPEVPAVPVGGEVPMANQQAGVTNEQYNPYNPSNVQEMPTGGGEQVYSAPAESTYSSNVAVSNGGGGIPRWFYVVFAVTLIAFLVVTFFLITTILKPQGTPVVSEPTPTPATSVTILPSPTVALPASSPTPTPDPVVTKLQEISSSDEIAEIEKDVNATNLSSIMDALTKLDGQMKTPSK